MGWWILQMILSVPVPVILLLHVVVIAVYATNQTIADGGSPVVCEYHPSFSSFLLSPPFPFLRQGLQLRSRVSSCPFIHSRLLPRVSAQFLYC